jgi:hypothetical protein
MRQSGIPLYSDSCPDLPECASARCQGKAASLKRAANLVSRHFVVDVCTTQSWKSRYQRASLLYIYTCCAASV